MLFMIIWINKMRMQWNVCSCKSITSTHIFGWLIWFENNFCNRIDLLSVYFQFAVICLCVCVCLCFQDLLCLSDSFNAKTSLWSKKKTSFLNLSPYIKMCYQPPSQIEWLKKWPSTYDHTVFSALRSSTYLFGLCNTLQNTRSNNK